MEQYAYSQSEPAPSSLGHAWVELDFGKSFGGPGAGGVRAPSFLIQFEVLASYYIFYAGAGVGVLGFDAREVTVTVFDQNGNISEATTSASSRSTNVEFGLFHEIELLPPLRQNSADHKRRVFRASGGYGHMFFGDITRGVGGCTNCSDVSYGPYDGGHYIVGALSTRWFFVNPGRRWNRFVEFGVEYKRFFSADITSDIAFKFAAGVF